VTIGDLVDGKLAIGAGASACSARERATEGAKSNRRSPMNSTYGGVGIIGVIVIVVVILLLVGVIKL
jgi:hypothetical protein